MSKESRREWETRARRPGLASVMSTRWPEDASRDATADLKHKILGALGDIKGERVLEIGSGIGRFTQDLKKAGAQVVAVDHSMGMIQRARKTTSDRVPFLLANAAELPLGRNTFDTAVAITVLQHITDLEEFQKALNGLKTVTKKRIIICDELRDNQTKQVSEVTVLRTLGEFTKHMNGWDLTSKEQFTCITDEYTLMVWEKSN